MDWEVPTIVYVCWAIGLVAVVALVPVLVYSLRHLDQIAGQIARNCEESLAAGVAIANSTSAIGALDTTLGAASGLLETAGSIRATSGAIADVLAERARPRA